MLLTVFGLPEVIAGVAGLILLYAISGLIKPVLQAMANRIPLIGGTISKGLDAILSDAESFGRGWAENGTSAIVGPVLAPVFWFEHITAGLLNATDDLQYQVRFIGGPLLNSMIGIAISESQHYALLLAQQLAAVINQLYAILIRDISLVYSALDAAEVAELAYTTSLVYAETVFIEAEVATLTAFVEAEVAALEGEIVAEAAAETAYTTAAIATESAFIEAEVVAIEAEIATSDAAITSWVTGALIGLQAEISAVEATVTEFVTESVQVVQTELTTLEQECVNDLCDGTKDLAKHLKGLMAQGWIAALLGYAAWAATDPSGCGHDTGDVLKPIATGAADTVRTVINAL